MKLSPTGLALPELRSDYERALSLHRAGNLEKARQLYTQIVESWPNHADALHMLGMVAIQSGYTETGMELIGRSLQINPGQPAAYSSLGNALRNLQRPQQALDHYDRALNLDPQFVPALYNRGSVLMDLQRPQEALESYERALLLRPKHVGALCNYGNALLALGRHQDALLSYERALQLNPNFAPAACARGKTLRELHRLDEALHDLEHCLVLDSRMAAAHQERGSVLRELQRLDEAVLSYDRALELEPRCALTFFRRSIALVELGKNAAAAVSFARALAIAPDYPFALGGMLFSKRMLCDWTDWKRDSRQVVVDLNMGKPVIIPFTLLGVSDSAAAQLQCTRSYVRDHLPPAPEPLYNGERYRHGKIRIAYVSGDFRVHAVSALLARIFEQHDRKRFDVIAISLRPAEDSTLGRRLKAAFHEFIDVSQTSDLQVARLIRQREIDIVVDLMGFTGGSRTGIFAHRAAPIQVNYLGFPGTMGAPYMDYILADEFVIPNQSRQHYAEEIAWLPDCFQPNDNQRVISSKVPSRRELSLLDAGFVFCCFNNNYKINPTCFDVWMRLLRAIPHSVLWVLAEEAPVEKNLREEARRRGVDPERLIFARRIPYPDHLARLQCADLFLDTVPFNAGTTASDALWAGLPILTCAGEAFAARMAGSLLRAVGLPELITSSLDEYEAAALKLATTPPLLSELRSRLAQHRMTTPLFDSERFCRHLESAYVSMWERAERGMPPDSFVVQDSSQRLDEHIQDLRQP